MAGRFISLEGGEGAGKSTQAKALAELLERAGCAVVTTREPGGTRGAEAIRALLLEGGKDRWTVQSEALLFAAARADHVARLIRPALAAGKWVISDRFVDSSRAYQASDTGLSDEDILRLHAIGSGGLLPDRTFVLTLPAETAARRAAARDRGDSDRIGSRDADFHAGVAARFAAIAAREPDRVRLIDADRPAEAITQELFDSLSPWLE